MAKGKKGFVLYADQIETFTALPDNMAGKLIKHIFKYVNDEDPVTDDLVINIAFTPIKTQLKRDLKKYEKICERNRENGLKGGRPKTENNPQKPTGLSGNRNKPKKPDKDNDIDSDIDKEKDIKKNKRFVPPTIEMIKEYIKEKKYSIDADKWFNHYTANGWMVGKNKMKDWKAAVRTWLPVKSTKNNGHDWGDLTDG